MIYVRSLICHRCTFLFLELNPGIYNFLDSWQPNLSEVTLVHEMIQGTIGDHLHLYLVYILFWYKYVMVRFLYTISNHCTSDLKLFLEIPRYSLVIDSHQIFFEFPIHHKSHIIWPILIGTIAFIKAFPLVRISRI